MHASLTATAKSVAPMGAMGLAVNVKKARYVQMMVPAIPVNLSAPTRNVEPTVVGEVVASAMTTSSAV